MTSPVTFRWTGVAMVPHGRFAALCERQFGRGEDYRLVTYEQRSEKSHDHFFVTVAEAFKNLREDDAIRFPTEDHLRKWALIKAGYADERSVVCSSKAEAVRLAAFVRPLDDYAVVAVSGAVVTVWTAKSQSLRAMSKATFQKSKDAVLGILAAMIGVTAEILKSNTPGAVSGEAGPPQPSGSITEAVPQANVEAA